MNRRDFLKISAVSSAVLAGGAALGWALKLPGVIRVQQTRLLMGTIINMTVIAADRAEAEAAVDSAFAEMDRLVAIYDHRRPEGPLGRLNRDGILEPVPAELRVVLARALEFGDVTQGAFDISVKPVVDAYEDGIDPEEKLSLVDYRQIRLGVESAYFETSGMQVTLDGIAKGAVVDGAVANLTQSGFQEVLVEAGGDLRGAGSMHSWRVAVDHPRRETMEQYAAAFELQEAAAATSGDYMKSFSPDRSIHHIIDPRWGQSPTELASTTVVAPTATDADALSTALMVLGVKESLALANELAGVEALVVTKDLMVHRTDGFPTL